MPPSWIGPEFVLSAFDRLIDQEPEVAAEARPRWVGPVDQIKESIQANLMWLLNSRRSLIELPPGRHPLQRSLLAMACPTSSI